MNTLRYCTDGGSYVGGDKRLPDDPCEFQHPAVNVLTGCNRLKCGNCGAWVRTGPPGLVGKADLRSHLAELHATERWDDLPYLERRYDFYRLYLCRCNVWLENNVHLASDPDPTPGVDPILPWSCAGHPVPVLPLVLGDVTLTDQTPGESLVERLLAGWIPRHLDGAQNAGPALWASWLYAYLHGLPLADGLSEALGQRIEDPEPETVGRVLAFFTGFPRARGVEHLIERAEAAVQGVAVGYPFPETQRIPTFVDVLIARIDQRDDAGNDLDRRASEVLKKALLLPLSELSHENAGTCDHVEAYEAHYKEQVGELTDKQRRMIDAYAKAIEQARTDVLKGILEEIRHAQAFDPTDGLWLADHIVEMETAVKGRWKSVLSLLHFLSRHNPADFEHLLVIAGVGIIQSGIVDRNEIRDWIRMRASSTDAWALPLQVSLDKLGV